MTFEEAQEKCAEQSDGYFTYDLVSIQSSRENDFVKELNEETNAWQAWIGLKRDDRGGWTNNAGELIGNWTDGTVSRYQAWGRNEPSNISPKGVSD